MKKLLLLLLIAFALCLTTHAQVSTIVRGSATYTNSLVVSSKFGTKLFSVTGYNSKSTTQFIQVFQTNAVPANGAIPTFSFPVSATNYFSLDFGYYGADLDRVTICNSTTGNTLTIGSADCGIQSVIKSN